MPHPQLPTDLDPEGSAFFFDCDGTLAAIVERPDTARVEPWLRERIGALAERCGGALAIVSGRSIEQLDAMLAPLKLPAAGVHGIERRGVDGSVHRIAIDGKAIEEIARRFADFAAEHPGLIVEPKPGSVALHYRMAPEAERKALDFAGELVRGHANLRLLRGKMVVEIGAGARTKGDAIAAFMREAPFAGRRPVFAGDDVTDEDGFAIVEAMGGLAIKIGPGETSASARLGAMDDLHGWIDLLCRRWAGLPPRKAGSG